MTDTNKTFAEFSKIMQREYSEKINTYLFEKYESPPLAFIHTFGCQQNISDSERIRGMLSEAGYGFTEEVKNASLILYNTCAIREGAQDKIFGNVGELKKLKSENPDLVIALCGCMVQQGEIVDKIKKSYPFVSLIFGTHVTHTLPQLLYTVLTENSKVISTSNENLKISEDMPIHREDKVRGNIPIMYGCDNYCTYCIVPYVRGRERSRSSTEIIKEAKILINQGYKELMLLGQNVNSYGKGLDEDINFSKLLKMINALEGDFTIRFMTSHPKDCTTELIDTISECEKVCRQIHLPIQSGNNRVLQLMNRKYTKENYIKLVNYAKKKIPDITFSSDIIVGFPGESYEEFCDTHELIKEIGFTQLFTYIYSPRPGTAAALFEDNLPHSEKSKRLNELIATQAKITAEFNKSLIGKELTVLVDGTKWSDSSYLTARTVHGTLTEIKGDRNNIGNYVRVQITGARNTLVTGEIVHGH